MCDLWSGLARGLYAGTIPSLAAQVSENAVLFLFYGACQRSVMYATGKQDVNQLSTVENAFSGSFAGFFASFVLCPTELVKCKLQAMKEMNAIQSPGAPKSIMLVIVYVKNSILFINFELAT